MTAAFDKKAKQLYLAGKSRQEAMHKLGITNTNSMSSLSSRLKLYWRWPLENRKQNIEPPKSQLLKSPSGRKKTHPGGTATGTENRIKSAQLRADGQEVEVDEAAPETVPGSRYARFGPPPHMSSRERRERGINENPAFDGIPSDITRAFAPYYSK